MASIPSHIISARRALCRSCDCGADAADPCAACGRGKWHVHRACLPSLTTMAAGVLSAGIAEASAIAGGAPPVSPAQVTQRLAICQSCDRFLPAENRCVLCGCYVAFASRLRAKECPQNKWPPYASYLTS